MIPEQILKTICEAYSIDSEKVVDYPSSFVESGGGQFVLCSVDGTKKILATGKGAFFSSLDGDHLSETIKLCPLSHRNRLTINQFLPYTLPTAFGKKTATLGLGDRLGLATPGHIRCFKNTAAKPVLAQQSKRELDLTGRTYEQVLDDVCFAVFQEGYRGGFGADGDHLKKPEDIREALDSGYTMITLDCSEKIGRGIEGFNAEDIAGAYEKLPQEYRSRIEAVYLSKCFPIGERNYSFRKEELMRCALIYCEAIEFTKEVYHSLLKKAERAIDFELSIDETESVTTAQDHLFVAMELEHGGVDVTSLAPRFIGEFQKGIDYIGDAAEFEDQLKQHAAIAKHFGYKLSIHSGSDKFSVFPAIGTHTEGLLHLKTSGTNWLEAVGTIAEKNPPLYRRIHEKALRHFAEAKAYYHVSGEPSKVEDPAGRTDDSLVGYLADPDSRQLLHITYGFILRDPALRGELYRTLLENEEHYYSRLSAHIGCHMELLNLTGKEDE